MIGAALLCAAALAGPARLPADAVSDEDADRLFRGRKLALLVGPTAFDDAGFGALRYTGDDALALGAALDRPGAGFDSVITLTTAEQTTLADVRAAMAEMEEQSASPDDTIFIYFSTHGTLSRDRAGRLGQYVVLTDTELERVSETALSHDEILEWVERLPSRRKVIVLATCHSGQGKSSLPPTLVREFASSKGPPSLPPLRDVSEALVLIGVCAWNETARESEDFGHDIYTWYFLESLEQGDLDGDGAITLTEAHDYARRHTYAYTQGAQRPFARAEILGTDPIVLTGTPAPSALVTIGSHRAELDGYQIHVDGQAKGVLPEVVAVEAGTHRVELVDPAGEEVVMRQRLRLRGGSRLDMNDLFRKDRIRLGLGLGVLGLSVPGAGGGSGFGELHLPRFPGGRWELVVQGGAVMGWPMLPTTMSGGIEVERTLLPGTLQLRLGPAVHGILMRTDSSVLPSDAPTGTFLEPSLVPGAVLSTAYLPREAVFVRLAVSAGYLWHTEHGNWHHGWTARSTLVGGVAF